MEDILSAVIARSINEKAVLSQSKLTTIYGPKYLEELDEMDKRWEDKEKEIKSKLEDTGKHYSIKSKPERHRNVPEYEENSTQKVFLVNKGQFINTGLEPNKSLLFHGLSGSYITIRTKANHTTISNCKGVRIHLLEGTVSGIDIIRSSEVYVSVPYINYANIEVADRIRICGSVDKDTKIKCSSSMDVYINGVKSRANPFKCIAIDGYSNEGNVNSFGWIDTSRNNI